MLPACGYEQDWEVELADASRVGEFLEAYKTAFLTADDKVALMALLIASVDRYMGGHHRAPEEWQRISNLLTEERILHNETIKYWACEEMNDPEGWFPITPFIRTVLAGG